MSKNKSLERKIKARLIRRKSNVFIRDDFADLGGYDQVGRVLRMLTRQGDLARLGYGIYAKTRTSQLTGDIVPVATLPVLAKEALQRLGVKTMPSSAEKDYQAGLSTQVPTGRLIGVDKPRLSRKISYKEAKIYYERIKG